MFEFAKDITARDWFPAIAFVVFGFILYSVGIPMVAAQKIMMIPVIYSAYRIAKASFTAAMAGL